MVLSSSSYQYETLFNYPIYNFFSLGGRIVRCNLFSPSNALPHVILEGWLDLFLLQYFN